MLRMAEEVWNTSSLVILTAYLKIQPYFQKKKMEYFRSREHLLAVVEHYSTAHPDSFATSGETFTFRMTITDG
jgi:hypothetical protein